SQVHQRGDRAPAGADAVTQRPAQGAFWNRPERRRFSAAGLDLLLWTEVPGHPQWSTVAAVAAIGGPPDAAPGGDEGSGEGVAGPDPRLQDGTQPDASAAVLVTARGSPDPPHSFDLQRFSVVGPGLIHQAQPAADRPNSWPGRFSQRQQRHNQEP